MKAEDTVRMLKDEMNCIFGLLLIILKKYIY